MVGVKDYLLIRVNREGGAPVLVDEFTDETLARRYGLKLALRRADQFERHFVLYRGERVIEIQFCTSCRAAKAKRLDY